MKSKQKSMCAQQYCWVSPKSKTVTPPLTLSEWLSELVSTNNFIEELQFFKKSVSYQFRPLTTHSASKFEDKVFPIPFFESPSKVECGEAESYGSGYVGRSGGLEKNWLRVWIYFFNKLWSGSIFKTIGSGSSTYIQTKQSIEFSK